MHKVFWCKQRDSTVNDSKFITCKTCFLDRPVVPPITAFKDARIINVNVSVNLYSGVARAHKRISRRDHISDDQLMRRADMEDLRILSE